MENLYILYILSILGILIGVIIWILLRKHKPELLGLHKDINKQKIDGVKLKHCTKCLKGFLEPQFSWWRYFFGILLPFGIVYIIGKPNSFLCNECGNRESGALQESFFTRISLTHRLKKPFFITFVINCILAVLIFVLYFNW